MMINEKKSNNFETASAAATKTYKYFKEVQAS
jgi:hypothetical protein